MRMAVEKPDPPANSYKSQEYLITCCDSVFSELVHTESKMIIFTSGPLQDFSLVLEILQTVGKEAEMIDPAPKLKFCLDALALKVACDC